MSGHILFSFIAAFIGYAIGSPMITISIHEHSRLPSGHAKILRVTSLSAGTLSLTHVVGTSEDGSHSRFPSVTSQKNEKGWLPSITLELLGLRAHTNYIFTVEAEQNGVTQFEKISFSTGSTLQGLPDIVVESVNSATVAPGWTWTSVFPAPNAPADDMHTYITATVMLDNEGEVVWALGCQELFGNTQWAYLNDHWCGITGTQSVLNNGNLLVMWGIYGAMVKIEDGFTGLAEVDYSGTVHKMWVSSKDAGRNWLLPKGAVMVDTMVLNHHVEQRPNGNLIGIAFDHQTMTCDEWGPDPLKVYGNEIVEFDYNTGEIYQRWSMFGVIDPCATADPTEITYNNEWTHLNSLDVSNVDSHNELILSSFYLGWVIAVRYEDDNDGKAGSLKWILGKAWDSPMAMTEYTATLPRFELQPNNITDSTLDADNIRLDPGQHNVGIVPGSNGSKLLAFDNSANEARGMGVASRLVIYDLLERPSSSEDPGLVEVAWAYDDSSGHSPFLGGAQYLDNGNILGDFGALTDPVANWDERLCWGTEVCNYAHIVERTPDGSSALSVFIGGRTESGSCGWQNSRSWNSYRAFRLSVPEFAVVN